MSMFNEQCLCMACKDAETKRADYKEARDAEAEQVRNGNFNFKGIGMAMLPKAVFRRKALDIEELKTPTDLIRGGYYYIIEKVVELGQDEYDEFAANLMDHYGFIEANIPSMFVDTDDVWHCILVRAAGAEDGILVESEGYTYARYAAYLAKVDNA
jgi:hypothetical protein